MSQDAVRQDCKSGRAPELRIVGTEEKPSLRCLTPGEQLGVSRFARQVLEQEARAILERAGTLNESFLQAVELVLNCQGNVIVSGMGKAGQIGQKIAASLSSLGTPSHFLHPAEAIHGDLGMIRTKDILLILSHSGETGEILRLIPFLEKMRIPYIAMTASRTNTLGRGANSVLELGELTEADPLNLAPTTSTAVMLALGDALALAVSKLRGFSDEDFALYHPGGSLGRRLSRVEEQMRPVSACRVAFDHKTIRDIFVDSHVPGRRSGAILLINKTGKLSGIFTDSDLAKLFEARSYDLFDTPVNEVMTRNPKVVTVGTRMKDALTFMGEKKISELPVLDEQGRPVGMLDITDLVSFMP
ncbi:MAG: KpsF/GutQ family sugar-phosphate isomerase [Planctomycetia bacterium]|nr:KpsF/GutQ family sugar-phosphate isomerase [Planctomycetia bacterium]